MKHVLGWDLIHRSENRLRELLAESAFGSAPVEVRHDTDGVQVFLFCGRHL